MAQNNRLERDKVRTQNEVKGKRSKASLYGLSDPHKYEVHDEWGDVNPGSGDYSDGRPRINRANKERRK